MNYQQIIETVSRLFIATDSRNWNDLKNIFDTNVLLDYSSMTGGEPSNLSPDQIIDSWKAFLPGFDSTHHQLGNFIVKEHGHHADVFCYGTASHYLINPSGYNVWTVVGSYNIKLNFDGENWKVTMMKFNFKYMDGNSDLARLAQEKLNKKEHSRLV